MSSLFSFKALLYLKNIIHGIVNYFTVFIYIS